MKRLFTVIFFQLIFISTCLAELTPLKDYLRNKPTSEWLTNKAEVTYMSLRCGSVTAVSLAYMEKNVKFDNKLRNTSLAYLKIGGYISDVNGMHRKEFSDALAKTTAQYSAKFTEPFVADDLKICLENYGEYKDFYGQVFEKVMIKSKKQ